MALLAAHSLLSAFAVLAHVKCISWTSNVPNTHALTHTDTHTHTVSHHCTACVYSSYPPNSASLLCLCLDIAVSDCPTASQMLII